MKCPLITMSAITGKPSKDAIFEYLKGLKDNGIEQALLYPRSGCELEYLSEEWFDTVFYFIEAASGLDMCLWLYDDFNWPSGDAHGRVSAIPQYRLKSIVTAGDNIGTISCKSRHNSGLFGEKYFPDLLSYDAVDYFIKCTHEEYYKRFGKYFGNVIKGMFTDEPSIGYCCEGNSIPYYEELSSDYEKLCGRNFKDDMLNGHKDFYLNATEVISKRFNDCYISRISAWCKEHGILATGHLMCDNDPFNAVAHNGRFLKNLSSFSLPGIDEIHTDFTDISELTLFGAIEYASGENGAMAELFALGPCDMPYSKKRLMLYLASAFKVSNYFLAISHTDMRGNMLVTDFFNNFNTDQPDFAGMKLFAKDAEKAAEYASKDFTPDVYIRYPYSVGAKRITDALSPRPFWELVNKLTYAGKQWKFINSEVPCSAPIIELNENMEFTLDGAVYDADKICEKIRSDITVKDKNGDTPSGIFVRKFDDGSIIVLNLFAPSGEYIICGKEVYIGEYGVLFSLDKSDYKKKEISTAFNVSYGNYNIIRTMYVNGSERAEIFCNEDTNVIFAVRNGVCAKLNGKELICVKNADILSVGMKELYKISDPVSLKRGINTLSASDDFKYMPCVFILGDFSAEAISGDVCRVNLDKRKSTYACGDLLFDYGRVELSAQITVPFGAKGIEISRTQLYTLVFADGLLLGERIAAPYVFDIDKGLCGKNIHLKIVQFSAMGNIFGDVAYWDKASEKSQWRGTPSPERTPFGFKEIKWILRQ